MYSERILWLDIAKIVATFLVVVIHTVGTPNLVVMTTNLDWVILVLYDSFSRICVPLFVMVSGALLLKKTEPYKTFFKKRINRILLPWLVWTGIYLMWFNISKTLDTSSIYTLSIQIYSLFINQFWFLPMIIGLYLITPPLRVFLFHAKRFDIAYLLLFWGIVYSIYPLIMKIMSPHYTMVTPYALEHLGYYILGYALFKWHRRFKTVHLFGFFLTCVLGNCIGTFVAYGFERPDLQTYFWNNLSFFAIGISASAFLIIKSLFARIEPSADKFTRAIIAISNASLGIYLVHFLILEALSQPMFNINLPYALAILTIASIAYIISMGIILITQHTKLKHLFS